MANFNPTHIARIDVRNYFRQDWMYAFWFDFPVGVRSDFTQTQGFPASPDAYTVLIPALQEYDRSSPAAVHIAQTLAGGKHVEDRGKVKDTISLRGTSGFYAAANPNPTTWQTFTSELKRQADELAGVFGGVDNLNERGQRSGYAWFHRFERMFELYWQVKRLASRDDAEKTRCVFVAEKDDLYVHVAPLDFRYTRRKTVYDWTMTLETLSYLQAPSFLQQKKATADKSFFALWQASMRDLERARSLVQTMINTAKGGILSFLQDCSAALESIYAFLENTTGSVISVLQTPDQLLRAFYSAGVRGVDFARNTTHALTYAFNDWFTGTAQTLETLISSKQRLETFDRDPRVSERLKLHGFNVQANDTLRSGQSVIEAQNAMEDLSAALFDDFDGVDKKELPVLTLASRHEDNKRAKPSWEVQPITGERQIAVQDGDTLQRIALRELGDVQAWTLLAAYNQLDPPYILSQAALSAGVQVSGNLLRTGGVLLIPLFSGGASGGLGQRPNQSSNTQGTGVVSSATTTVLTDALRSWIPGQWIGYTLTMLSGVHTGLSRRVTASTATTITLDALPSPPAVNDVFLLAQNQHTNPVGRFGAGLLLGLDFALVRSQDSVGTASYALDKTSIDDAAVTSGLPSLVQSLQLFFDAAGQGSPFSPDQTNAPSGLLGGRLSTVRLFNLRVALRTWLLNDPRVLDISREVITLGVSGDALYFDFELVTQAGSFPVRL